MKKLFVYSALILALGACKSNSSDVKKDDKSSTPFSTTETKSTTSTPTDGTTSSTTTTNSGSWSSTDKDMFMKTCTDAAVKGGMGESKASNYCSCMLGKIETAYPNSADAGKMTANETTEMAKECLK